MLTLSPMVSFVLHWSHHVRVAAPIELSEIEEDELIRLAHSKVDSVRLVERARIVLLAAQGLQDRQIAEELDIDRITAGRWRKRYINSGLAGIERDLPRGAPPVKMDVPIGHKLALKDLKVGDTVIKYGQDIGRIVVDVRQGEHVHVHNLKTKRW